MKEKLTGGIAAKIDGLSMLFLFDAGSCLLSYAPLTGMVREDFKLPNVDRLPLVEKIEARYIPIEAHEEYARIHAVSTGYLLTRLQR